MKLVNDIHWLWIGVNVSNVRRWKCGREEFEKSLPFFYCHPLFQPLTVKKHILFDSNFQQTNEIQYSIEMRSNLISALLTYQCNSKLHKFWKAMPIIPLCEPWLPIAALSLDIDEHDISPSFLAIGDYCWDPVGFNNMLMWGCGPIEYQMLQMFQWYVIPVEPLSHCYTSCSIIWGPSKACM